VNVVFLLFAKWRDDRNEHTYLEHKSRRRLAFVLSVGSYGSFAAGIVTLVILGFSGNENLTFLFVVLLLTAAVLAFASVIAAIAANGWTRMAAALSGTAMVGYVVYAMTHLDS